MSDLSRNRTPVPCDERGAKDRQFCVCVCVDRLCSEPLPSHLFMFCHVLSAQRAKASYVQRRIQGKLRLFTIYTLFQHITSIHSSNIFKFMWVCRMTEAYLRVYASGTMSSHTGFITHNDVHRMGKRSSIWSGVKICHCLLMQVNTAAMQAFADLH